MPVPVALAATVPSALATDMVPANTCDPIETRLDADEYRLLALLAIPSILLPPPVAALAAPGRPSAPATLPTTP